MPDLIPSLRRARVVPVIRTHSTAAAETAVRWLHDAGLRIFEITMTVPEAPALIRALSADRDLIVGAGTVRDTAQAGACLAAGAQFLVTPWVDAEVVRVAKQSGAAMMAGAMTPTEVRAALAAGADVVKIFPASSAGGPAHLKALAAVFPGIAFCPTGGVDARNAPDYLAAGAAFVGIGGKLVDEKAILAGDRDTIRHAAEAALGLMHI